jgi:hypothetical protein
MPVTETPVTKAPETKAPAKSASKNSGHIYIGVGGWTFAPWRGVFYPEKLTQAKELEYAASKLTSIEINGTYYGARSARWFCVLGERATLCHQPPGVGGGRRFHQVFLQHRRA